MFSTLLYSMSNVKKKGEMLRPALLEYLYPLFDDGMTPSGDQFHEFIEGVGKQADRPRISLVATGGFIPDNILTQSMWAPVGNSQRPDTVMNVLCDYYANGWFAECVATCTHTPDAKAYYYVASQDAATGRFTVFSLQFNNPGFDKGKFASEDAIRILLQVYDRSTGLVTYSDYKLLLTALSNVVMSNDVSAMQIVYGEPPRQNDGVLYIQMPDPASCSIQMPGTVGVGVPADISVVLGAGGYSSSRVYLRGTVTPVTGVSLVDVSGSDPVSVELGEDGSFTAGDVSIGFVLGDTASYALRGTFATAGNYAIKIEVVTVAHGLVLASATGAVQVE